MKKKHLKIIGILFLALGVLWFLISFCGLVVISWSLDDLPHDELMATAVSGAVLVVIPTFILVGIGAVILRPEMWITLH